MLVKYQTSIQLKAVNILTRCHLSTDTTYINIYIYMVPPPMYPRLSAKSRLQDYVGHLDWGFCRQIVPFVRKFQHKTLAAEPDRADS